MILPIYLYEQLFSCLEKTMANEKVTMGNIQFLDPEKNVLMIAAHKGFDLDFLHYFKEVKPFDTSACGRAVSIGNTVIVHDVDTDPGFAPHRDIAHSAGFRSVRSVPILSGKRELVGVISTHSREPNWDWKTMGHENLLQIEQILRSLIVFR